MRSGGPTNPVADVGSLGAAYVLNAISNPHLYRFMFLERPPEDPEIGHETFERLIASVARAIEAGRFSPADPERLARELWAMTHGIVMLHLAGLFTVDDLFTGMAEMGENLFVGFGDSRGRAAASIRAARERAVAGSVGQASRRTGTGSDGPTAGTRTGVSADPT